MKFLLLALLSISLVSVGAAQTTHKVLFIGNSYTGVNNLPLTIENLALSNGDSLIWDSNTPGGYTLQGHSTNATTLNKIAADNWDFVVLQEQSQKPSFPPAQVATEVYPYAEILNDSIKANDECTETVFYMTWGRKNGDASNCASYPPLCTYDGMQTRLRTSYLEMGNNNSATVAPVGVAWRRVRQVNPAIELYNPDESHPSVAGTYLAACVFYATMYQKSPKGLSYISSLSASDALFLQTMADSTVFDSLSTWNINGNLPAAGFTHTINNTEATFTDNSTNATAYNWDFGDGTTSTLPAPVHTYASAGTYTVKQVASTNCAADSTTEQVLIEDVTSLTERYKAQSVTIYPNPASTAITIITQGLERSPATLQLVDVAGKLVVERQLALARQQNLNVGQLTSGIYQLVVRTNGQFFTQKLVITDW